MHSGMKWIFAIIHIRQMKVVRITIGVSDGSMLIWRLNNV